MHARAVSSHCYRLSDGALIGLASYVSALHHNPVVSNGGADVLVGINSEFVSFADLSRNGNCKGTHTTSQIPLPRHYNKEHLCL
eukprot:1654735-Pyramimonas_sp.AAC.3